MVLVVYPPYSVQVLQWEPLTANSGSLATQPKDAATTLPSVTEARSSLQKLLQQHEWLLQQDQHLTVPPTHLDEYIHKGGSSFHRVYSMGDFVKRAIEARDLDVEQCAYQPNGSRDRRLLTTQQEQELRQTGVLTVPSCLLEDQHHTWQVAPAFYSGSQTCRQDLKQGVGKALDHFVVYSGDALTAGGNDETVLTMAENNRWLWRPSLVNALPQGPGRALRLVWDALRQMVGGHFQHPTYAEQDIQAILQEAELGYCQHHLRLQGYDTRRMYVGSSSSKTAPAQTAELWDLLYEDTEWGQEYRRSDLVCRQEQQARNELMHTRRDFEEHMGALRKTKLTMNLAKAKTKTSPKTALAEERRAESEWQRNKSRDWIDHLKNIVKHDLKELAALEVDRLVAVEIEQDVEREDTDKMEEALKEYEDRLAKNRPIMSLSGAWRKRKLKNRRTIIAKSYESTRLERVAKRLDTAHLDGQSNARKLLIKFRDNVYDVLARRLRCKRTTFPLAEFKVLQLNPYNWNGTERYKTVAVDLGRPFGRLRYSWMMFISLTKAMMGGAFRFLTAGPLSIRALVSPTPYYAVNFPVRDESSLTSTLTSRLGGYYQALEDARASFESTPDKGMIGKSIQRTFLKLSLAAKSVIGSMCIVGFMTTGTVAATVLNTVVLTAAPILAAVITSAEALFNLAVYDTALDAAHRRYSNRRNKRGFVGPVEMPSCASPIIKIGVGAPYYILVPGALQGILAIVRILVVHPIAGTAHLTLACFRFAFRSLRDSVSWPLLRKYSRIPAVDTFLAWRIHGPGLAPTEYYRLPVEAAKASVLLLLDKYRLVAHAQVRNAELEAPYNLYRNILQSVVQPFGVGVVMHVGSPSMIGEQIAFPVRRIYRSHNQEKHSEDRPPIYDRSCDIWDRVAYGIRSADPGYRLTQETQSMLRWSGTEAKPCGAQRKTVRSHLDYIDESIRADVDAAYKENKSKGKTELVNMVNRAGKLWAEWTVQIAFRDEHLTQSVAIPPVALGRFRMSKNEQDDLWEFTVQAVETYGLQLKHELEGILFVSQFSNEIRATVDHAIDSFYTHSGARSGTDFPVVAAFALSQLLGGEEIFDTLEETDEALVLSPTKKSQDEHLVFWKSLVHK